MSNQTRKDILYRLVLAKNFFSNANRIITDPTINQYSLAQGLLCLHDALDIFLGAVVSKLIIKVEPKKNSLYEILGKIEERKKTVLNNSEEIKKLNTVRNSIKHQGIPPNISFGIALLQPIKEFFIMYCQDFFDLSWDTISLADLIKEQATKQKIKYIEKMIEQKKYKESLNMMAELKFMVFEYSDMLTTLNPRYDLFPPSDKVIKAKDKKYISTSDLKDGFFSDSYERIKLVEQGIDRIKLSVFESLTAIGVIKNDSSKSIELKHGSNWGEPNWTKQNAIFCYNFLLDSILKTQNKEKEYDEKIVFTVFNIKIINKGIVVYKSNKDQEKMTEITKLEKDNEYEAQLFDYKDNKWENFGKHTLISVHNKPGIFGYIRGEDIKNIKIMSQKIITGH